MTFKSEATNQTTPCMPAYFDIVTKNNFGVKSALTGT